jgi:hypothetical protein
MYTDERQCMPMACMLFLAMARCDEVHTGFAGHGEHVALLRGKKGGAEELQPWQGGLRGAVAEIIASQNPAAHLMTMAVSRCNRKSTRGRSHRLQRLDGGGAVTANGPSERSLLRLFKMEEGVNGEGEGTAAGLKVRRGCGRGHACHPVGGAAHRQPRGG